MSLLLLKARPTLVQLADRLQDPRPDGLELYLDTADLADQAALDSTLAAVRSSAFGSDDALLIEGPIRSLDGRFFDLTHDTPANRELIDRLAWLAERLAARAVNLHAIAPAETQAVLTPEARWAALERSLPLASYFANQVRRAGAIPTVENMPPVLRMRESSYCFTPIGLAAEDLVWLCERVEGLRATLDLSHAGLYLNCRRYAASDAPAPDAAGDYQPLWRFVGGLPPVSDVLDYGRALGDYLLTAHVANARGLLGEGEPYDQGDLDLDRLIGDLASSVSYFVTETLETQNERALEMRRALGRMRGVVGIAARS